MTVLVYAADPAGPFGHGLLKPGSEVLWFYCHFDTGSCQRTLSFTRVAMSAGALQVTVRAYDDHGRGVAASGATVHVDSSTAVTAADGSVTVAAAAFTSAREPLSSTPAPTIVPWL